MQKGIQSYFQTKVTTTSRGDVLIMLYDGAIKFLQQAKEKIIAKDPAAKGILISKALDIINELDSTLNAEKGGDLVENLHNLYFFCNARLLMANLKMDATLIDQVIKILTGLRAAYAEINTQAEVQSLPSPSTVASTPVRTLAGTSSTGTVAAPVTPGSNMRRQNLYAKTMTESERSVQHTDDTVIPQATVTPVAEAAAPTQIAKPMAKTAAAYSAVQSAPATPQTATPVNLVTSIPQSTETPAPTQMVGNFTSKPLANSQLYKKFAANQQ